MPPDSDARLCLRRFGDVARGAKEIDVLFECERAVDQIVELLTRKLDLSSHHAQQRIGDFLLTVADLRTDDRFFSIDKEMKERMIVFPQFKTLALQTCRLILTCPFG